MDNGLSAGTRIVSFGRRKVTARACIADSKKHLRAFLSDILEDLGFVTCECAGIDELGTILETEIPDLVLLGIAVDGLRPARFLETLVRHDYGGKILAIGAPDSIVVKAVKQVGEEYGLAMLTPLTTPFDAETLRDRVALLLPEEPAPSPALHVQEALHAGWLELWFQQKIDARSLVRAGAEALVRVRHPTWGVIPPAFFIPAEHDPHLLDLSKFVVERAIQDWHYLLDRQNPTDISINLPTSFLRSRQAVRDLCNSVPRHPAFGGLLIEIDSAEALENLPLLVEIAKQMSLHNIGLSIDNVGADWPTLAGLDFFPFVELKVNRQFVTGCGHDGLKRAVCRQIVEMAASHGARVVAEGVESHADLVTANEVGFDVLQGHLFGKPMALKKFARSSLAWPLLTPK
ncbi:MAG: EAL domain-containing response regulator [Bradyrhizobium sp.]|uniref:EAL domain-containing response regulator n=1 Tax=Bradyrhizobium sp. TaxID=376 RepID=UPI0025C73004|nr:EAL domain-containing response regulator [Bradyrhizobium sp.]MBI5265555.1 EAL domain-containing response regulator [Bradyrhizobium sp.]